jgi:hypothetical protein
MAYIIHSFNGLCGSLHVMLEQSGALVGLDK